MRRRTWKILNWDSKPDLEQITSFVPFTCECGAEADCPVSGVGVIVEGVIHGMTCVTDPSTPRPFWFLPNSIQCRKCGRSFEIQSTKENCVR